MGTMNEREPMQPDVGQRYTDILTGKVWKIAGHRSGQRVCLVSGAGDQQEIRDYTPITELAAWFKYLDCDHVEHCCRAHQVHVSPHSGCLLR